MKKLHAEMANGAKTLSASRLKRVSTGATANHHLCAWREGGFGGNRPVPREQRFSSKLASGQFRFALLGLPSLP